MKNLSTLRNFFNLSQPALANKLSLEKDTIARYEVGKLQPSFKALKKFVEFFEISFDFLLLDNECEYPKNLKLLRLAKKLDELYKSEARNTIESSAKSLLGNNFNAIIHIKNDDSIALNLTDNFNSNLKEIRKLKNINQAELAEKLNISRSGYSQYELRSYPSVDKLIKLSGFLNISTHALTTGEKLSFNFIDGYFGKTIFLADKLLSLEQQNILITLMEAIIKNSST
jgi:transcriptional regulator with XRE-family HTH domain